MKWWDQMLWSYFSECWILSQLFPLSSFTFIKSLFSSSFSAIRVVSSAYLRLLIFLPAFLIPACALISHRYMYVPLLSHLPPPTLSHPSRCHRAVDLNSLHNTANFHWLSDFTYGNIYVPVLSVCLTLSFFPPPHPCPQRPGYKGPWNSWRYSNETQRLARVCPSLICLGSPEEEVMVPEPRNWTTWQELEFVGTGATEESHPKGVIAKEKL